MDGDASLAGLFRTRRERGRFAPGTDVDQPVAGLPVLVAN